MSDTDNTDPLDYEFDPRPSEIEPLKSNARIAVIRNSDRVLFRRCRRRWGWNSHLKANLGPKETAAPLWLGSGFHFALEDYHGYKFYPSCAAAFKAYVEATRRKKAISLPPNWKEQAELGIGMLDYYEIWLEGRSPLQTFVWNGVPQVEVNVRLDLPWEPGRYGFEQVVYSGTLDRVAIDEYGHLWIVEYKTAKQMQTMHFAHDGQISSYCWIGNHLYPGYEVVGVIYQQHRKDLPKNPPILGDGSVSVNKQMLTTHRKYRNFLIQTYHDINKVPRKNIDFLNTLARQEDSDGDKFIKRHRVRRNAHQRQAEGVKILLEIEEMLNPDLPLYPNPTRECTHMCAFNNACTSLDDGSDWEHDLALEMEPRDKEYDRWRQYLPELPAPPLHQVEAQIQL